MTYLLTDNEEEQMVRNTLLLLYDGLNTEIDTLNTTWGTRDTTFFASFPQRSQTITVEHISNSNFYFGHVPALIDADVDKYPNVAVMTPDTNPIVTDNDQVDMFLVRLWVEIMVRAQGVDVKPDQDDDASLAELVNARLSRTSQAVRNVLRASQSRSLSGIVPKFGNTPLVQNGDVFVRRESRGKGPRWFWQGTRIEYRIEQWVTL